MGSQCDLDYNDGALASSGTIGKINGPDRAWRVAVFASDITANGGTGAVSTDPAASDAKVILTRSGAVNQDTTKCVDSTTTVNGVASYNTWNTDYLADMGTTVGATKYLKVTVRVWLEGEDTSCKSSTYAQLTDKYELAAKFELLNNTEAASKAVTNLQSDTSKVKAADFPSGS